MTGDGLRDQLAAGLPHEEWCHEIDRARDFPCPCDDVRAYRADALLPAVRKIAADELRAAANAMRDRATRLTFEAKVHMQHEARLLDRRAAELDPQ